MWMKIFDYIIATNFLLTDDKYTIVTNGPSYPAVESSFKHYTDGSQPPEVINVTSSASGTILPPDQVIDVSRAPSLATLNGGGGTLPRSTLSRSHHGTLKKPIGDESRPLMTSHPYEPG